MKAFNVIRGAKAWGNGIEEDGSKIRGSSCNRMHSPTLPIMACSTTLPVVLWAQSW